MSLLGKKKNEVSTAKGRYDIGLDKIMSTEVMVTDMQKELEDLQPVLVKMTKENQEQMVVIEKSSKEAAVTKGTTFTFLNSKYLPTTKTKFR